MNNTFSFERFVKVLKYDLKFRVPGFMVTYIVLLTCMHILFFAFHHANDTHIAVYRDGTHLLQLGDNVIESSVIIN